MNKLSKKIANLTKRLRLTAYQCGPVQNELDAIPFGGSIRESIGPFPEFILKGRFCVRSMRGQCSPCFYSRLPVHNISKQKFDSGYEAQVEYILHNFEELIVKNQIGHISYRDPSDKKIYSIVCTPTGSYFDEHEYPVSVRKSNLEKLFNAMIQHNCEIVLHIESHAEDVIKYFEQPDMEEIELLHKLHTRVLLGFESVNEFSRNILYSKQLSIEDFEKAVDILKAHEFPVGAFVFAGLFAYTDEETIEDTRQSLLYLKETGISPVLMFSNTQKYTIPDVLLDNKKFKLLDPRTVAAIVKQTIDIFGCEMTGDIDPWFIADPKGGPPDPNVHIFNADSSTTCPNCANRIYLAIENLRITKNAEPFLAELDNINHCNCLHNYMSLMQYQKKIADSMDTYNRANTLVDYANSMFEYYTLKENPWKVKAELLCHGLNITDTQKAVISSFHPFIYEKGFINAIHIIFGNVLVNVCVSEKFCSRSPYSISQVDDGSWLLLKDNVPLGPVLFLNFPDWVYKTINGDVVGKNARPHSDKCISIWPSLDCSYVKNGNACKYCGLSSLSETDMTKLSPKHVTDIVQVALAYNPNYEINLSGGTCGSPNEAIEYLSHVCASIVKDCGKVSISVECAPPSKRIYIEKLKASGATAIIINIEIHNATLRKSICSGKGGISNKRYYNALKDAVEVFGQGNVSSVIIVGIQPKHDVLSCCAELIELGVIPTLIPFKPLDGTPMQNVDLPNCAEYIDISRKVSIMLKKKHLKIDKTSGCAACGACSLEKNLEEIVL